MSNQLNGILGRRIALTQKRLLDEDCPKFTPGFILADVQPHDPTNRRFSNFSGDISGRFLGALSLLPKGNSDALLKKLAREIVRIQGTDGRFGDPHLDFFGSVIDRSHMPLLWGNGRLLVGLLEYYSRFKDKEILKASVRLGDFLDSVSGACQSPEAAESLKSLGAFGFICFTQCNEGLVMLGEVTGESRYSKTAATITKWILPRGQQHSHGYLTTLRGVLMLHQLNGDVALLKTAEKLFGDLVKSRDYLPMGGVPEYFSWDEDPLNKDSAVAAHSTSEARDEGCSEADFLRLCLQLWRATGKISYLEKAEHCLFNHLLSNQFANGDFGHRHLTWNGFKPSPNPGRAWWCCTMHALRAFKDVEEFAISRGENSCRVNLFLDCDLAGADLKAGFRHRYSPSTHRHFYAVKIGGETAKPFVFSLRQPEWAETLAVRVNGKRVKASVKDDYLSLKRSWKKGDEIELEWRYKFRAQTQDNRILPLEKLASSSEVRVAAIFYGPWLLGVHDANDPMFFSEPNWHNLIHLPDSEKELEKLWHQTGSDSSSGYLELSYTHEGFPGRQKISLRPLCQQTGSDQRTIEFFLRFGKAK